MGAFARILVVAAALVAAAPAAAGVPDLRGAQMHPFWGGVSASDSERELDALVAGGANAVRVDISWSTLELRGPGQRDADYVARIDAFLAAARQRRIGVIAVLWTTPCWASSAPADVRQDCAGAWWERGVERYPPSDPDDFADAATWVADRWSDDLAALELWNEANFHPFFRSDAPAEDYADLVAAAYPRIKAVAPGLPVIGPGMLHSDAEFVEALYDEGAGEHLDGISSHPFVGPRSPYESSPAGPEHSFADGIPSVQAVLESHGDGDKRQWLTELGWSSCAPGGTSSWCVTLEQQAERIGDAFEIIRERWDYVAAAVVYNLRNKGTSATDRESQMGLLFRDFSAKPAWHEFTRMMGVLAAPPPPPTDPGERPEPTPGPAVLGGTTDPAGLSTLPAPGESIVEPPPELSRVRIRPRTFRARRRRAGRAGSGARVHYHLSRAATVEFALERCRRRGCRALPAEFSRAGLAGANSFRFSGVLRGRRLRPGRYRLVAAPVAGEQRGAARRAAFRLVP